jgi:hypothetical protein
MTSAADALSILLEERGRSSLHVPKELIESVYRIEERVQFDQKRSESPGKIAAAVRNVLDKEDKGGTSNGNAS